MGLLLSMITVSQSQNTAEKIIGNKYFVEFTFPF